jgi:hypothetical protein
MVSGPCGARLHEPTVGGQLPPSELGFLPACACHGTWPQSSSEGSSPLLMLVTYRSRDKRCVIRSKIGLAKVPASRLMTTTYPCVLKNISVSLWKHSSEYLTLPKSRSWLLHMPSIVSGMVRMNSRSPCSGVSELTPSLMRESLTSWLGEGSIMPTYRMFLSTENIMSATCSGSIACAKPQETLVTFLVVNSSSLAHHESSDS